jgi:hypothetical protein
MASVDVALANADEDQCRMMEERVILVDEQDRVLGHASKKECVLPCWFSGSTGF